MKDPAGEWIPVDGEPRLMRKADASKGEKGIYKLYPEGIDNDGDGEYNEDPAGGTNIAITFPHLFHPWTATGGRWPGSEPETFGIMKFAIDHPEIGMTFAFGATNMCLQPPAGGRTGSFDANAIKIPERMAGQLGADATRTYSMKEIIDLVRPLAPPGFEITEGIDRVVPRPRRRREPARRGPEVLQGAVGEVQGVPEGEQARRQAARAAAAEGRVVRAVVLLPPGRARRSRMDLWTLPEVKAEEKEKSGITAESLEGMTPDAFVALGEAKIAAFLKEVGAPDNIKPAMLLEGVKSGKMTPKQMAGMLKQMPKPKDAGAAPTRSRRRSSPSATRNSQGKGFVAWTPFKHPTLGDVEIGGFAAFGDTDAAAGDDQAAARRAGAVGAAAGSEAAAPEDPEDRGEADGRGRLRRHRLGGEHGLPAVPDGDGAQEPPRAAGRAAVRRQERAKDVTFLSGRARTPINEVDGGRSVKLEWLVQVPPTRHRHRRGARVGERVGRRRADCARRRTGRCEMRARHWMTTVALAALVAGSSLAARPGAPRRQGRRRSRPPRRQPPRTGARR